MSRAAELFTLSGRSSQGAPTVGRPRGWTARVPVASRLPALLLLVILAGCAGAGRAGGGADAKTSPPPDWARSGNGPALPGLVCAVGIAGPTFFRFDAVEVACDAARTSLARSLRVRVHTSSLDIQTNESGMKDSQTVVEVASTINDLVLEGSRIVEVWYDEHGAGFARKPSYTYALACIDEAAVPQAPASR